MNIFDNDLNKEIDILENYDDQSEFSKLSNSEKILIVNSEKIIELEEKMKKQDEFISKLMSTNEINKEIFSDLIQKEREHFINNINFNQSSESYIEEAKTISFSSFFKNFIDKIDNLNIFFSKTFVNSNEIKKYVQQQSILFIKKNILSFINEYFLNLKYIDDQIKQDFSNFISNLNQSFFSLNNKLDNISSDRRNILINLSHFICETQNISNYENVIKFKDVFLSKNEIEYLIKKFTMYFMMINLSIIESNLTKDLINLKLKNFIKKIGLNLEDIDQFAWLENEQKSNKNIKDNVIINNDIKDTNVDLLNFEEESDEEMKHNYYGNQNFIPGTKITKIKNYKHEIENDLIEIDNLKDQYQNYKFDDNNSYENEKNLNKDNWIENNQKLLELENLILKQEEEINILRNNKSSNLNKESISTGNFDELVSMNSSSKFSNTDWFDDNSNDKSILHNISESVSKALDKIDYLSQIQEKNVQEISDINKKVNLFESGIKSDFYSSSSQNDDNFKSDLESLIHEKYKLNSNNASVNNNLIYIEEYKKLEDERKKINETLELEKIRLLSEIEFNKNKLSNIQNNNPVQENNNVVIEQEVVAPVPPPIAKPNPFAPKQDVIINQQPQLVIMEKPKKKRKQQMFFEIKVHNTPKLTRADIEK